MTRRRSVLHGPTGADRLLLHVLEGLAVVAVHYLRLEAWLARKAGRP